MSGLVGVAHGVGLAFIHAGCLRTGNDWRYDMAWARLLAHLYIALHARNKID